MKQIILSTLALLMVLSLARQAGADTMADGMWQVQPDEGIRCENGIDVRAEDQLEFFEKYASFRLHLSAAQAVKYVDGRASRPFPLLETEPGKKFVIQHTGTTINDAELTLGYDQQGPRLELRSLDREWDLCGGKDGRYILVFRFIGLN